MLRRIGTTIALGGLIVLGISTNAHARPCGFLGRIFHFVTDYHATKPGDGSAFETWQFPTFHRELRSPELRAIVRRFKDAKRVTVWHYRVWPPAWRREVHNVISFQGNQLEIKIDGVDRFMRVSNEGGLSAYTFYNYIADYNERVHGSGEGQIEFGDIIDGEPLIVRGELPELFRIADELMDLDATLASEYRDEDEPFARPY
jgi:hypothetical protein